LRDFIAESNHTGMKNKKITCDGEDWLYSDTVKNHFFNPRNLLLDEKNYTADGVGVVGSPACGDMMAVWIKIEPQTGRIMECKWRTFGCASAIASTSMMSEMATEGGGMPLAKAKKMTPEAIIDRLGGLPDRKYHCSVLGHLALREAIEDYEAHDQRSG
jgi:NifU-like protein involved in Fe-S cluster formation